MSPKQPPAGPPLTEAQRLFVAEYIANRGNGTRAYLASHPKCTSYAGASVEAYNTLRNPRVLAVLNAARSERFKRLEMDGDEAIALLSLSARADMADAFDPETGELLQVPHWPDSLRLAVKGIKANGEVLLHDGLKARELCAVAAGRLKSAMSVSHTFDHAAYLADDLADPEGKR